MTNDMSSSSPANEPQNRPAKASLLRRVSRNIGILLASLVVLSLLWAGAQIALRRPIPKLLYTEADLPKMPPPADNGWEVLRLEMQELGIPQRPDKDISAICDGKATFEDRWPRAIANAEKMAHVVSDEKNKRWLDMTKRAASRPQFADACPITFEPKCPRAIHLLALHEIQESAVLHDALTQHWREAFAATTNMLRVDAQFLPSGRSTLSLAIGRAQVLRSMTLVNVLMDGAESEKKENRGPDSRDLADFAHAVEPLLKNIREEDMVSERIVMAEYVFSAYAIEHLTDSPQARLSSTRAIFYDPGQTLEMLNERFEKYADFARHDGAGAPPEFTSSRLRYLRNPIGQLVLGSMSGAIENQIPAVAKDRALILKARQTLAARLEPFTK